MYPEQITDDPRTGVLALIWPDGLAQQLPHCLLRSQCQCSACRSGYERTGMRPIAPPMLRITQIRPVGNYGLQLVFSDGHERGIYPWPYLRSLAGDRIAPQLWN